MLNRDEANALVEALNGAGFSCSLDAKATGAGHGEFEIGMRIGAMDLARLDELLKLVEQFPDAKFLLSDGHITLS